MCPAYQIFQPFFIFELRAVALTLYYSFIFFDTFYFTHFTVVLLSVKVQNKISRSLERSETLHRSPK